MLGIDLRLREPGKPQGAVSAGALGVNEINDGERHLAADSYIMNCEVLTKRGISCAQSVLKAIERFRKLEAG